jgi:hypothetical protein
MAGDVMISMGANPLQGPLEESGPEIETSLGPKKSPFPSLPQRDDVNSHRPRGGGRGWGSPSLVTTCMKQILETEGKPFTPTLNIFSEACCLCGYLI